MSVATASPPAPSGLAPVAPSAPHGRSVPPDHPPWAMPLAAYEKLVESGLFSEFPEFRRVYLWEGRLCERMTIDRPHVLGVRGVFLAILGLRIEGYEAETEAPMAYRKADSAPQPDIKVVRGLCKDYNPRMPTTTDVPLVVEVTDSTLSKDRGLALTYAIEEIPVYWLVNIPARRVEVYSAPVSGVYTSVSFFEAGQEIPVILDGREVGRIRVADLLP